MKPRPRNNRRNYNNTARHLINGFIRAQQVRVISDDSESAVMSIKEALALANEKELDLVQISGSREEVPICKIIEYSKFKYELSKKEKLAKKKQRENTIKLKEIKFRPSTDSHDLETKARHAQEFIDDGHKLKVTIVFRGREMAYKDVGVATMDSFVNMLSSAVFESRPSMSGRILSAIVVKSDKKPMTT